jgi:hypothetical protein
MLVGREINLDLIVLESKRENGYRHPHCINILLSIQEEKKNK